MSIINCPECGGSISDKAKCCIHCGYPLENKNENDYNCQHQVDSVSDVFVNKTTTFNMVIEHINEEHSFLDAELQLKNFYHCQNASQLLSTTGSVLLRGIEVANIGYIKREFRSMGYIVDFTPSDDGYINPINSKIEDARTKFNNASHRRSKPLTCPHCGSTSVTTGQRGFSLFSGFWGSNKTVNRCGSCGWTWQPKR